MTPPERLQDVTLAERLRAVIASMDEFSTVLRRDTAHLDGLFADAAAAMLDTVSDWRKHLEAAAALSVRGWLPMDRAEKPEAYLVANEKTGHVAPLIRGVIHNAAGAAYDWHYGEAVTHWMPLPEAPATPPSEG